MGVRGADGRSRLVNVTDTGRDKRTKAQRHWRIAQEQLSILLDIPRVLALHDLIHESFDLLSPNDKTTDAAKSSCFTGKSPEKRVHWWLTSMALIKITSK